MGLYGTIPAMFVKVSEGGTRIPAGDLRILVGGTSLLVAIPPARLNVVLPGLHCSCPCPYSTIAPKGC